MILKNSSGIKREFNVLLEIEKNKKKYIVYEDPLTKNIYSGKYSNGTLKVLNDKEFAYIDTLIENFNR